MNEAIGPVAGRLRRPSWRDPRLLVGVLLIAISVVAVSVIVRNADVTTPHYAARETITPGTVLEQGDFVVVSVRVASGTYVTADQAPWGQVVARTIGQGELVPTDALVPQDDFDGRPVAVQSSLPLASGIGPGALVDVYLTVEGTDGRPITTEVASALVVDQVVRNESAFGAGAGETVYVVVPARDITDFLDAIATEGDISVVGLAGSAT